MSNVRLKDHTQRTNYRPSYFDKLGKLFSLLSEAKLTAALVTSRLNNEQIEQTTRKISYKISN